MAHGKKPLVRNYENIVFTKTCKLLYNSIIGENEHLTDFLVSRDTWKYYQFIAECIYLPSGMDFPPFTIHAKK